MSKLLIRSNLSLRANYKLPLEFPVASLTSVLAWKSSCMYCLVFGVMTMANFWRKDSILVGNFCWVVQPETFSHYFFSLNQRRVISRLSMYLFLGYSHVLRGKDCEKPRAKTHLIWSLRKVLQFLLGKYFQILSPLSFHLIAKIFYC